MGPKDLDNVIMFYSLCPKIDCPTPQSFLSKNVCMKRLFFLRRESNSKKNTNFKSSLSMNMEIATNWYGLGEHTIHL